MSRNEPEARDAHPVHTNAAAMLVFPAPPRDSAGGLASEPKADVGFIDVHIASARRNQIAREVKLQTGEEPVSLRHLILSMGHEGGPNRVDVFVDVMALFFDGVYVNGRRFGPIPSHISVAAGEERERVLSQPTRAQSALHRDMTTLVRRCQTEVLNMGDALGVVAPRGEPKPLRVHLMCPYMRVSAPGKVSRANVFYAAEVMLPAYGISPDAKLSVELKEGDERSFHTMSTSRATFPVLQNVSPPDPIEGREGIVAVCITSNPLTRMAAVSAWVATAYAGERGAACVYAGEDSKTVYRGGWGGKKAWQAALGGCVQGLGGIFNGFEIPPKFAVSWFDEDPGPGAYLERAMKYRLARFEAEAIGSEGIFSDFKQTVPAAWRKAVVAFVRKRLDPVAPGLSKVVCAGLALNMEWKATRAVIDYRANHTGITIPVEHTEFMYDPGFTVTAEIQVAAEVLKGEVGGDEEGGLSPILFREYVLTIFAEGVREQRTPLQCVAPLFDMFEADEWTLADEQVNVVFKGMYAALKILKMDGAAIGRNERTLFTEEVEEGWENTLRRSGVEWLVDSSMVPYSSTDCIAFHKYYGEMVQ